MGLTRVAACGVYSAGCRYYRAGIVGWLARTGTGTTTLYVPIYQLHIAPVVQVVNLEFYLCLSPGFEPQVGRTLTLFAKIKKGFNC